MRQHRDGIMWLVVVSLIGLAALSGMATAGEGQESPVTQSISAATSLPVVPSVLVGPRKGPPEPPSVLPLPKPTPPKLGTVTYAGLLPPDLRVSIPALRVLGKGDVAVEGDVSVRVSADGTLWLDQGSSVTFDPASTGTKSMEGNMWKFDKFSGTIVAAGSNLRVRAKGERLLLVANKGQGTATMSGEGTFRLTRADGRLESGFLDATTVKKPFEKFNPAAAIGSEIPAPGRYGTPPAGLIPREVPEAKIYEVPKLPSQGGKKVAPPSESPTTPPPAPTTNTATPAQ